jgi:hypothetical protein
MSKVLIEVIAVGVGVACIGAWAGICLAIAVAMEVAR